MKITFNNFRCYESGAIELPDEGLVLLSGESGAGKSTILEGIFYALFSIRGPYTRDTNTCYVTLEWNGMFIRRSSKAPVLRLKNLDDGKEYLNDDAQNFIDTKLGLGKDEFKCSSYVHQKSRLSILTLSPADQLKFIETLVFDNNSHEENMIQFKKNIEEKKHDKIQVECTLNILLKQLESEDELDEDYKFEKELSGMKLSELEKRCDKIEKKLSCDQTHYESLKNDIDNFENENFNKLSSDKNSIEIELSQLKQRLSSLGKIPSDEKVIKLEEQYSIHKKLRDDTQSYNRYVEDKNKLGSVKENYFKRIREKNEELKKMLISPLKIAQMKKKIQNIKDSKEKYEADLEENQILTLKKNSAAQIFKTVGGSARKNLKFRGKKFSELLNFLEQELKLNQEKIKKSSLALSEYISQKENLYVYECPGCEVYLTFKDESLELADVEEPESEFDESYFDNLIEDETIIGKSLELKCDQIKEMIQKLQEIEPDFKIKIPKFSSIDPNEEQKFNHDLLKYQKLRDELEENKNILKNKILSEPIIEMENNLSSLKTFDEQFESKSGISIDEINQTIANLITTIDNSQKKISDSGMLSVQIRNKSNELRNINNNLKDCEKHLKVHEKNLAKFQELSNLILNYSSELNIIKDNIIKMKEFESWKLQKTKLVNLRNEIDKNKSKLIEKEESLVAAYKLEEIGHESEILAIESYIENINQVAKIYLDQLFKDEISVRLENHKLTTKGIVKAQINVEVEYGGHVFNSISSLSGGEIQRCELAFMLAINDITSSGILLLDECLNNLDTNLNMKALEFLQNRGVLTFVISHEAIKGVFREVVNVDRQEILKTKL